MIQTNNIKEFFEKYIRNLEQEEILDDQFIHAEDEGSFIDLLKQKSTWFRRLFIENETMLNLYLRPILNQENL